MNIIVSIFLPLFASGQDYVVDVKTWELKDGLSNRHVNTVIEDEFGFVWIGTRSGLQRFDGIEFKTWGHKSGYNQFGDIRQLLIDADGWLWCWDIHQQDYVFIHTLREEVKTRAERFGTKFPIFNSLPLKFSMSDERGVLYAVNPDTKEMVTYTHKRGFKKSPLTTGTNLQRLEIIAINEQGVSLYSEGATKEFLLVSETGVLSQRLPVDSDGNWYFPPNRYFQKRIIAYEFIGNEDVWTQGEFKAFHLDWSRRTLEPLQQSASLHTQILDEMGCTIYRDSLSIWKNDKNVYSQPVENFGKVFSDIYPKFVDSHGRMWLCGPFGLARLTLKETGFERIAWSNKANPLPFNTAIRGLTTRNDTLFAIFEFNGIGAISLEDAEHIIPVHGKFYFDAHYYNSYSLACDNDHLYTVHGGELIQFRGVKRYKYPIQAYDANDKLIRTLDKFYTCSALHIEGSKIWIGANDGLWIVDKQGKGSFHRVGTKKSIAIRCIFPFENDMLLCTEAGLYRFDIQSKKMEQVLPGGVKGREYYCVAKGSSGSIYFGTNQGLLRWEPKSDRVREYTEKDGLSQKIVAGVYPDRDGNLWISTFFGLNRLNPVTGKIETFYEEDGICHNEFNFVSHHQDAHGKMYFGGLNGITVIDPSKIGRKQPFDFNIHLTQAEVFSENSDRLKDITGILRHKKSLVFHQSDRFVKLKFVIPNLSNQQEVLYAWKIQGKHDTWNYQRENSIQLSNLPYGNQVLLIKGKTDDGNWTQPIRIAIDVESPFYLTTWFLVLVTVLGLFAIYLFIRVRTYTLRKKEEELRKQVSIATEKISKDRELIQKQADELKQLDESKMRFFTNVTHEFKTPLTLIQGPLGTVLKSKKLDTEMVRHVEMAKRNTEQLLKLVTSLLDLSKFDNGMLKLEESDVGVLDFVNLLLAHFESHMKHVEIKLILQFEIDLNTIVRFDRGKCETILNNLLSNAVKFTPRGRSVTLKVREIDGHLSFSVIDTGRGIKLDEQQRIFDRFYQISSEGIPEEGGTGIGLSLSLELTKVMHGSLTVQSELGIGSTFELRFPWKKRITFDTIQVEPEESTVLSTPGTKRWMGRILTVEDNLDLQQYLSAILTDKGYATVGALNGKKALELLDRLSDEDLPNLILSDIMMPEMDGYQLLEELKRNERYWHIPVVILTARSELSDKLRALRIGVDDYLLKPFEEEELIARIENLLKHSESRSEFNDLDVENDEIKISSLDQRWLEGLEAFVSQNLSDEHFDVGKMHDHFAMSSSTFLRKVKALTGMTPVEYLRESRYVLARKLLENRDVATVSEVAYTVGFGNPKSFSRSFRNRFGKLPREYFKKA